MNTHPTPVIRVLWQVEFYCGRSSYKHIIICSLLETEAMILNQIRNDLVNYYKIGK